MSAAVCCALAGRATGAASTGADYQRHAGRYYAHRDTRRAPHPGAGRGEPGHDQWTSAAGERDEQQPTEAARAGAVGLRVAPGHAARRAGAALTSLPAGVVTWLGR